MMQSSILNLHNQGISWLAQIQKLRNGVNMGLTLSKTNLKLLTWLAAGFMSMQAMGQSGTNLAVSAPASSEQEQRLSLTAGLATGRLLVQSESIEADRYTSFNLALSYKISSKGSLVLKQGLDFTPDDTSSQLLIREDDKKTQLGATRLRYKHDLGTFGDFAFGASVGTGWYHAEYYQDLTRYADLSLGASVKWSPTEWISYSLAPGYTSYFHRDTLANTGDGDAPGSANAKYLLSASHALTLTPSFAKDFSLALSYGNLLIDYYSNKETAYLYSTSLGLGYQATDDLNVSLGISNLNSQITNDEIAAVVLNNKDMTTAEIGLNYKVF